MPLVTGALVARVPDPYTSWLYAYFLLIIGISLIIGLIRWRWQQTFWSVMTANLFLWAVFLNYLWELSQLPLFQGFASFHLGVALEHCAWYTLGDATIVLSLYALGAWWRGTWNWGFRLQWRDYLWFPLMGMFVAIVIEYLALAWGRWEYGADMPLVPGMSVALLPVIQMSVLPLLSVRLAARFVPAAALQRS